MEKVFTVTHSVEVQLEPEMINGIPMYHWRLFENVDGVSYEMAHDLNSCEIMGVTVALDKYYSTEMKKAIEMNRIRRMKERVR